MDLNDFQFTTDANYLKRHLSGSKSFTLPASGASLNVSIDHNLGYKPQYQFAINMANPGDTGRYYANGEIVSERTDALELSGLGMPPSYPQVQSWATNTQIIIRVTNSTDPVASGTRTIKYVIYLDYQS